MIARALASLRTPGGSSGPPTLETLDKRVRTVEILLWLLLLSSAPQVIETARAYMP